MKRQLGLLLALTLILIAALGSGGALAEGSGGHVANLRIGTTAPNNTFNALTQKDAFGRMNYNGLTQSNFVYRDADNLLKPYFWKSFEISADGTSIAFTFPLDAVWHDGQPVTWDDIEFTFQYMRDVRKVSTLQHLIKIEKTADGAGLLTFDQPDAYYWLNSSCMNNACVYPKHIWQGVEDIDGYAGEDAAVGSGPYKLVSFDKEAQTSYYEAVPQNAFLGELTVDSVTLQTYSGEDTLVMAMLNGEIDCMFNYANPIDASIIDLVMENPDIDPGKSDFSGCYQLEYGKERALGSDEAFRQALAYAWNYPLLAATINGEYGQIPGRGIIPPSCKGYDETLAKLEYDVEKAKAMLDEAGYADADGDGWRDLTDGAPMDLVVTPQYNASMDLRMRIADVIMNSLTAVGVKNHLDKDTIVNSEVWEKNITEGAYDLSITLTTSGMAAYSTAFRYFMSELPAGQTSWLWGTVHDEAFTAAYYGMTQAVNDGLYIENARKLQKLFSDRMYAQALCWETAFFPYRTDKYAGWRNYPSWGVVNPTTWFELKTK